MIGQSTVGPLPWIPRLTLPRPLEGVASVKPYLFYLTYKLFPTWMDDLSSRFWNPTSGVHLLSSSNDMIFSVDRRSLEVDGRLTVIILSSGTVITCPLISDPNSVGAMTCCFYYWYTSAVSGLLVNAGLDSSVRILRLI